MDSPQAQRPAALPDPTDTVRSFYRFHARIYDQSRWAFLFGRRAALAALHLKPGHCALEIGCGTGLNLPLLASAVGPTGLVIGLDASEDMLRRARRRITRHRWPNVTVRPADATHLELETRFDAVLFSYSLAMMPLWKQALARAIALLKPGATLGVLDFGTFRSWPWPGRPCINAWLRLNHVHTRRPIESHLRGLLDNVQCHRKLGDYYFIATGQARSTTVA